MEIQRNRKVSMELNIAPLIDVVFLLLIFFMVTSTFVRERALELSLPRSESGTPAHQDVIRLVAESEVSYILNGKTITGSEVEGALAKLRSERAEDTPVLVIVDDESEVQLLVSTLDKAKSAGFTNISLATEHGRAGAPEAPAKESH